ncbi:MAG: thioesterase family protein [Phenylobacterium sp.]|uniref:thioesterase family protein n=1 Tax=Phenylobacterium sp. TaxID=1871053 RepID=UPI00391BDC72
MNDQAREETGPEVWGGGVNTWECDEMGHMNVRFYVAKSMEGLAGLAAHLGLRKAFAPHAESTLLVREQHIRFLREARPGAGLYMTGGVIEMGVSEARLLMVMRHLSGEPAATFQTVVAHATPKEGASFPWTERMREAARAITIPLPAYAAPRSLPLEPVNTSASLARADELGLKRIGLGVVGPRDCDVFGRMAVDQFMGRISDGIPRLLGRRPTADEVQGASGARIGGAALEYRLIHHAWPRAGDRLEMRSGTAFADGKVRRFVHWLLDPATGRPWGSAAAIAVNFDLDARKVVALAPEAAEAARAQVIEGLSL